MADPTRSPAPRPAIDPTNERRGFLAKAGALCCGGLVVAVPMLSGLAVFFDPLRRKNQFGKFLRVATLDMVPEDGIPREFPVIAERADAWNRSLEPIGAVYLRRLKGQKTPECLTATCPHAGCFIDFDEQTHTFKCPCHNSVFEADGQVVEPSPSPRSMDTLECKVDKHGILVQFQTFYTGKAEKVIKA